MGQPVVRFEITGRDLRRLRSFYSELFGWEIDTSYVPHYGTVERNTNAEGIGIAGAVSEVPEPPSTTYRGPTRSQGYQGHVTVYVEVPDVEAALAHAETLGGTRILGPDDVGGGTVIGLFNDPEGHLIGLVRSPRGEAS
jgi:predicted enzyme related to lactoylglutathione lyase